MFAKSQEIHLTPALEDYLETIYRLVGQDGFARVKDIATARMVKAGSVSPALRRLDELGLIVYERREFIKLTELGESLARRVYSRHRILRRFLAGFLGLPEDVAEADACAAEHHLSNMTTEYMVRLFEFIEMCPEAKELFDHFRSCALVQPGAEPGLCQCATLETYQSLSLRQTLNDVKPGQKVHISRILGDGPLRQKLLDRGLLPNTSLELTRVEEPGRDLVVRFQGFEVKISESEAAHVLVEIS